MNDLLGKTADGRDLDLEKGPSSSSASGTPVAPGMDTKQFFQVVNDVTSSRTKIRKRFMNLQNSNEDFGTVTTATAVRAIKETMDRDLDEISVTVGELHGKLETLDTSNAANREIVNCQAGSTTDRVRMKITSNEKTKLRELAVDFQGLRQRIQDEHREVVERRIFTVTGQEIFDESVIERLNETGDSEQIFPSAILAQGRGEVLDTIAEIQERHDAVKDIEYKLLELHQTFPDIGIPVEPEVEIVDNVEPERVDNAGVQVDNAFELEAARTAELERARRMRKFLDISIIFVVVIICILAIIFTVALITLLVNVIQPKRMVTK